MDVIIFDLFEKIALVLLEIIVNLQHKQTNNLRISLTNQRQRIQRFSLHSFLLLLQNQNYR